MKPEHAETVTVVICAYSEHRWSDLLTAVDSVRNQSRPAHEIIVVVDHNQALLERARVTLPGVICMPNSQTRGLSGARNSGSAVATGSVVAFLDDDAIADSDWLRHLADPFAEPGVQAVGGSITAAWNSTGPRWFPEEFLWVVGCSYRGLPVEMSAVRNVIGANMAFRREVFAEVGDFNGGIGRVGEKPVGCEETELCIRVRQRWAQDSIRYQPAANVRHKVPDSRATYRYFRSRCFAEGRSKALVTASVGTADGLETERAYTMKTLPAGVIRGVKDAFRGDLSGLARASAIATGLAVTSAGYLVGRIKRDVATDVSANQGSHKLASV